MSQQPQFAINLRAASPIPVLDRLLLAAPRHNVVLLVLLVSCTVALIGVVVIRDLHAANAEAEDIYTGSVHGLQQIGELQYEAQETRRSTLYALTTNDSDLQVEYADQSRAADQLVKDGIAEYAGRAKQPAEIALAELLSRDWAAYLRVRDDVLASILEGSNKEAVDLDLSKGVPSFEHVRKDLSEVKHLYDEDASQRYSNLVASSRRTSARLIGILAFTFLLSSASIWVIQRSRMLSTLQLAKLQMEFVASVSHELRTPLAVLSSAADNIADGLVKEPTALQRYGSLLQNQSRRMRSLVDEILLFASTEDGKIRYALRPLEVSDIVESAVVGSAGVIQEAGFVVEEHLEENLPMVMGDPSGILQCLQNLIGNAVKYGGDDRKIVVRTALAHEDVYESPEVRIEVSDHGFGIDASELSRIFEPFYRSPSISAMQIHGTGLGLALAKRIAEAMGGRLSVVSELEVGSTFTLHLQVVKTEDSNTETL